MERVEMTEIQESIHSTRNVSETDDLTPASSTLLSPTDKHAFKSTWTPWPLRTVTIVAFIIAYVLIIVALEVLYVISRNHQGLANGTWSRHYYWTYGPTAVLTVFMTLWHRVDYRLKQMQPWKQLAKGPSLAKKNLLVDYLSPSMPEVLLASIKNAHFAVTLSVILQLVLHALIIFSTGLFTLQPVQVLTYGHEFLMLEQYNVTNWNAGNVDDLAFIAAAGTDHYNISRRAWTDDDYALPSLQAFPLSTPGSVLNAKVPGFKTDLGVCETGTVQWPNITQLEKNPDFDIDGDTIYYNVTTPSYRCTHIWSPARSQAAFNFTAFLDTIVCKDSHNNTLSLAMPIVGLEHSSGLWDPFTFLVCTTNSSIVELEVSTAGDLNATDAGSDFTIIESTNEKSTNLSIFKAMQSALRPTGNAPNVLPDSWSNATADNFFYLLAWQNPDVSPEAYVNSDLLFSKASATWRGLGAQIGKRYLFSTNTTTGTGSLLFAQQRLTVKLLSARLMQAFLSLAIVGCLCLLWLRPSKATPKDPGSLANLATILAASPLLAEILKGSGSWSNDKISKLLAETSWCTTTDSSQHSFCIDRPKTSPTIKEDDWEMGETTTIRSEFSRVIHSENPVSWWRPLAIRTVGLSVCILIPAIVVAGLEVSLWLSNKHNGIVNVTASGYGHYGWTYVPAMVMVFVGILYSSLDSAVRILQPFVALRQTVSASHSLWINPLQHFSLVAIMKAIKFRQWALSAIILTAFLAPFLTIVVSGLFTIGNAPYSKTVSVSINDWFASSGSANGSFDLVSIATTLSQESDVDYPANTFRDIVLPQLALPSGNASRFEVTSALALVLPVLRNKMICRPTPVQYVRPVEVDSSFSLWSAGVQTWNGCGYTASTGPDGSNTVAMGLNLKNAGYFGAMQDGNAANEPNPNAGGRKRWNANIPCPWMVLAFGFHSGNSTNIAAILCDFPEIQEVDALVTLTMPDLAIDKSNPPAPLETTAKHFSNQSFWPAEVLQNYGGAGVWTNSFLYTLSAGKNSPPTADLLNATVLATTVEQLYAEIVAQFMNAQFRAPRGSDASVPASVNGTMTDLFRTRLQQNALSTRLLQGILGAMMLCAIVVLFKVNAKELLPKNPCSIAGRASLLVGAEMLSRDVIPEGSELLDETQLKARGVFEGYLFSMDRWEARDGTNPRWGIDIGSGA